jgi:PadR family transcriptional regulator, regulatory protein PadR
MPHDHPARVDLLQGTLDLLVLQTLHALGPLHGFGIARRIEQASGQAVLLNQGTIYASLVRLQQHGWISAEWGTSDNNRRAKYYALTKTGRKQLEREADDWRRVTAVIGRVLANPQGGSGQ